MDSLNVKGTQRRGWLLLVKRDGEARNEEGQEPSRPYRGTMASEADDIVVGHFEGVGSAGVAPSADLQRMRPGFDRDLDRLVQLDRSCAPPVDDDLKGATAEFKSERFPSQSDR